MRRLIITAMIVVLTLCFSWVFGHIQFSDRTAYALDKLGASLGIFGSENVEDFYITLVTALSVVLSLVIVKIAIRFINNRKRNADV
jgi:hypothetical protein